MGPVRFPGSFRHTAAIVLLALLANACAPDPAPGPAQEASTQAPVAALASAARQTSASGDMQAGPPATGPEKTASMPAAPRPPAPPLPAPMAEPADDERWAQLVGSNHGTARACGADAALLASYLRQARAQRERLVAAGMALAHDAAAFERAEAAAAASPADAETCNEVLARLRRVPVPSPWASDLGGLSG